MKQRPTLLLTALLLLTGMTSWGQLRTEASIDFSQQGYENAQAIESAVIDDNVTVYFFKGTNSNAPKYYNSGTAIRCYGGNYFTIETTLGNITSIDITFGSSDGSNEITTNVGSFSSPTWSGTSSSVTFTIGGTSGNRRIKELSVTYASGSGQQTVATPTFSPAEGIYFEAQNVSISCTTEEAAIHYTTDGTEPTESSSLYNTPITISESTTLKAKAFKSGYTASNIASATYTFPTLITIAEARALANNEYAMVQGIVTFIDSRNVYVQDITAGIDLYLNANASGINLGDEVKAYGKKTEYNGLVELTGINQNSNAFTVLTTGNALPVVVKTIAEVLAGADATGELQATRVKIEEATIGTINTSGNTTLTQGDDVINIYKVPALSSITEGDAVDITAIVGYYNAPQLRVALASDVELHVVLNPQLNVSTTSLSDFQYTYNNGPSSTKTFTVSGSDLGDDVVLTAPQNYELSHSPNNGYFGSETLSPSNGALAETTIYVRLKSGLAVGNYNGDLTIACDTLSHTIALSGAVTEQPLTSAPTFSPAGGNFITAQTVSMSCETEGAIIYYTTDGTDPTESSSVYSTPLEVNQTTTIKAFAVAPSYANSAIITATYTIQEVVSIATARTLANNEYACVEGTVTYMEGRNVYIQDATGGIDLYLNSNTVPSSLNLGDNVRAYGKKTTYNGLVELTGIAGNNANVFTVISTGNALPLTIHTIAEINADYSGDNLLQATRVKVENAIIGSINPSSTTVISQEGNSMNVYHIPTVEGMIQGDWVTITGVIGCYNAPQLLVASADDIQYTHRPTLTANPTSLNGFTYDYDEGGPSEIQHFLLAGDYLTDHVEVYPSESFEVSTFAGENFFPENPAIIFITNSGHFSNISIYVRMKAELEAGTYNEQVYAISDNADTLFINVEGTVTGGTPTPPEPPTPPTPGDGNYIRINDLSLLTEGSLVVFAARFDENATDYYAMSNQSSGKPTGVLFTSATVDEDEVLPASIVDEESNYYWTVGVTANGYTFTNANNELIGFSSSTNFATGGDNTEWAIEFGTASDEAMVPNYSGFLVTNVNNDVRHFALNSNHNFGPYHSNNFTNSGYNFYLDLFVKTEGGDPPTPTVATPTFNPAAGTYYEIQNVTISCTTADATLYYSTSENGPWTEYTEAIPIQESTTLWAYAVKDGYNNSDTTSATYTIQLGVVTIFNQDWEEDWHGWTEVLESGDSLWRIASYQGNHYAYANGYNHPATTDWLISPAFNIDAYENPILSFRTAKKYEGDTLKVFFSNNYDGEDPNATGTIWQPLLNYNLSQGNYIWVESGNINLDTCSGTNCYIGFKYTCEESQAAAWEVDDILLIGQTSAPVVTVAPLALTGFTYIEGNGPSDSLSFMVSGLNLSNSITITTSMNYEISLGSGSGFTQEPITLTPDNGNLEETPIYVRLKAGLPIGEYNTGEEITITCDDVDDIIVNCSGTVTEQPAPGDDYVRITNVSELAAGNRVIIASRYNETADAYLAIGNTLSSGKLPTTAFTSLMNGDDEIIPAEILLSEDDYYWTVDITSEGYTFTNANGDVIGYPNSGTNFVMGGDKTVWTINNGISDTASMVPEYEGFNIINFTSSSRAFAVRYYNEDYICGAYSTSNMSNAQAGEYNYFLDIFMQGEGGVPPTPTVAAPTFTPTGGTYYEAQTVTISCPSADTIFFSLFSDPYEWTVYENPIAVDSSMTICAYGKKVGCNDSPIVCEEYTIQDDIVIIFNQDWEEDWHGWTEVCEYGDSLWRIASYQGNHYAYANGYNHPATADWLISPAFDLDSYSDVVLTFRTAMNYSGPVLEVRFSNEYDGQNLNPDQWQLLDCNLSQGGWDWVNAEINMEGYYGSNCRIAFRYSCTDEEAAAWEVDDIMLTSGGISTDPFLIATPNALSGMTHVIGQGPSEPLTFNLTGGNFLPATGGGYGNVTLSLGGNSPYQISLDNEEYWSTLNIELGENSTLDTTIFVRLWDNEIGQYEWILNIYVPYSGISIIVTLSGTIISDNEPMMEAMMPLYIQGNNGTNNNRVPMAVSAQLVNLEPSTTYRYTNQLVDGNDGPETAGAGNVIYAHPDGFYRTTSPNLGTEGGYGEFTTDDNGNALVWLMNEPTANARFTPGNHVFMRVRINDGNEGTTVDQIFTSEDYATVLNFGNEIDEYSGSAFYVKSNEAPMSFAQMYTVENVLRPIYSTSIETTGVDYGSINQYADFYKDLVAGKDGWFGGIMPNVNNEGINFIMITDIYGVLQSGYASLGNGQWTPEANTINPTNGLDEPIFIDLTDDGVDDHVAANVKVWNANNEFVIENGDDSTYAMNVVNVMGQTVLSCEIAPNCTQRIAHQLATGIYVINLQNSRNNYAVKVMVR